MKNKSIVEVYLTLSEFSYIFLLFTILYAPVAQLVEQLPFKETVEGSSPSGRTTIQKDVFMASFCVDASECINCFMRVKDLEDRSAMRRTRW